MNEELESEIYEQNPPEAPAQPVTPLTVSPEEASTNFYWRFGKNKVFELQTTIRGNPTVDEIKAHLASATNAMTMIIDAGGNTKINNIVTQSDASATQAAIKTGKANVAPTHAAPPAPVKTAQVTGEANPLVLHIVKMTIEKRIDGRIDAKFFEAGHKWADISAVKTPAELVAMLSKTGAWTVAHFEQPNTFDVSFMVQYVLSDKLNSKGNPYRDIVSIK